MSKTKTVFFLGAGFSKDAGGPIQNELIETILSDDFYSFNDENVRKAIDKFKSFLSNELYFDESQNSKVVLEDVFTPIDRCISEAKSFGTYSYKELIGFRELLHNLLARAIQYGVDQPGHSKSYIDEFAKYLNEQSKVKLEHPQSDKVSVITTNWDILLDNYLFDLTSRESKKLNDLYSDRVNPPLAVVDYCCYISSLDKDELIKPGLLAIGRSGYNIKYLKLHGSMNWLHCPYCQRLYVKFHEKTMFEKHYCIHCKRNFNLKDNNAIKLRANLLMPTF